MGSIAVALDRARELRRVSIAWAREQDIEGMARAVVGTLGEPDSVDGAQHYHDEVISIQTAAGPSEGMCEVRVCGLVTYRSCEGGRMISVARPGRWVESLRKLALTARAHSDPHEAELDPRTAHELLERFAPVSSEI